METENKIIVIYIGVAGIRTEDIEEYVHRVTGKILPSTIKAEFIVVPTQSYDTRIECINPQYITDEELKAQHTLLMHDLNVALAEQIKLIKDEEN